MINDIITIMWKEWKELLTPGNQGGRGRLGMLLMIAVVGIIFPLQMGLAWFTSPLLLLFAVYQPVFLSLGVIADAFAGERERHTLETLLASRLSDRAILIGKLGTSISYGWGLELIFLVVGLVAVNLVDGKGTLLFYSPTLLLAAIGLSLLGAGVSAGLGVFVSLKAATIRQAQQTVSLSFQVLTFSLIFGLQIIPRQWRTDFIQAMSGVNLTVIFIGAALALLIINIALILAALARFNRTRLSF